ncbi:MAG: HAD family hydrolase [Nitrosomonadales bacterium]|nr:HAD family hydrolase [Nitrosomonadales bacterium]
MVLLDKDGTIIDIHHYWTSMIRLRARLVVEQCFRGRTDAIDVEHNLIDAMGVDISSGRMKPEGPVGVKPRPFIVGVTAATVRESGVDMDDARMEAIFAEIDRRTAADLLPLLRLLPGVKDLLDALRARAIAAAVVSTDITSRATSAMQALGIAHYFSAIIGGDAVAHTKPAPDLAHTALASSSCSPSRAAVIGDHPVDIQMGHNARCAANIAVLTGLSDADAFSGLGCTLVDNLTYVTVR